jgi:lipoprotein LpqH
VAAPLTAASQVHFSDILIGDADAGVELDYEPGKNEGNAEASKQGNFYKITGTATRIWL